MKNYWTKQNNLNKWVVVSRDMDGLTGHQVVHSKHAYKLHTGCYWSGIVEGISLDKDAMTALADKLNKENKQPSSNPLADI